MPAPGGALFDDFDLGDYLRREVSATDAESAERIVWGWLKPVLGLTERPDPVPDDVFSWALELGAIAYENPSGGGRMQLGSLSVEFPTERRDAILKRAGAATTGAPRGSFPAPALYPDPACW